jgi:hypothetical protein
LVISNLRISYIDKNISKKTYSPVSSYDHLQTNASVRQPINPSGWAQLWDLYRFVVLFHLGVALPTLGAEESAIFASFCHLQRCKSLSEASTSLIVLPQGFNIHHYIYNIHDLSGFLHLDDIFVVVQIHPKADLLSQ